MKKKIDRLVKELALLRRYRSARGERLPWSIRLPLVRNRIRKEAHADWPGGYVYNEAGQLVYVPQPVDMMGGYRLLKPAAPLPIIGALCKPGDVFVDVGANIGNWMLEAARCVGAQGRVLAVEPVPYLAEALRKTARANRLGCVTVAEVALAEAGGTRPFSVERGNSGGSRFGMVDDDGGREFSPITVRTVRLDDLVQEHALERLDVLKIDVEGFESDVLAGATASLARFRPAILMECGQDDDARREILRRILAGNGYEVVGVLLGGAVVEATLAEFGSRSGVFADYGILDVLLMPAHKEAR
jgi:FkbM family methyltransferase